MGLIYPRPCPIGFVTQLLFPSNTDDGDNDDGVAMMITPLIPHCLPLPIFFIKQKRTTII